MLSLSVLPLSFLICVYVTFSNLLVFFIIDWFVVFGRVRVQQSEINQVKSIYRFYIYFTRVFFPVDLLYHTWNGLLYVNHMMFKKK